MFLAAMSVSAVVEIRLHSVPRAFSWHMIGMGTLIKQYCGVLLDHESHSSCFAGMYGKEI
jgi:hypothetical protein